MLYQKINYKPTPYIYVKDAKSLSCAGVWYAPYRHLPTNGTECTHCCLFYLFIPVYKMSLSVTQTQMHQTIVLSVNNEMGKVEGKSHGSFNYYPRSMHFIHNVLSNMFQPVFWPSSG